MDKEVERLKAEFEDVGKTFTEKKDAADEAEKTADALKALYDKAAEALRLAEENRKAEEAKKAEAAKKAEEARKAAKAKPAKVTLKKVKSKKRRTVKVTWNKAKAAKKYEVAYRRKKSAKKWTKWVRKVVNGTSYTNKKLKSRRTYQFKVRGLNGKIKGKFSKMKKVRVK